MTRSGVIPDQNFHAMRGGTTGSSLVSLTDYKGVGDPCCDVVFAVVPDWRIIGEETNCQ